MNISGAKCVTPRDRVRARDRVLGLRARDRVLGFRASFRVRIHAAFRFRGINGQTASVSVKKNDIEYKYLVRNVSDFQ